MRLLRNGNAVRRSESGHGGTEGKGDIWDSSRILVLSLVCLCPEALHAGLIQRVDASVAGSVITNASGVVTSWVDQSGSGNGPRSVKTKFLSLENQ